MGCTGLPDRCSSGVCVYFYEGIGEETSLVDVYSVTKRSEVNDGSESKLHGVTHA